MANFRTILRWALVVPIYIGVYALVLLAFALIWTLIGGSLELSHIWAAAGGTLCGAWLSSAIVPPEYRRKTFMVIIGASFALSALFLLIAIITNELKATNILETAGGFIAIMLAVFLERRVDPPYIQWRQRS